MKFAQETWEYISRIRDFRTIDWLIYIGWIGMMFGLFASLLIFVWIGTSSGAPLPGYVWSLPVGDFIFCIAIAVDTIGHRTIYSEAIKKGEALVHHLTIFAGITSVLALVLGYQNPSIWYFPALILIFLSVTYSLVDEVMHWRRYLTQNSDRVEMWSHFFILLGHMMMVAAWWKWFTDGYLGVPETLVALGQK